MPDNRLIIGGGHHRVAAMRQLGETMIPMRVVDWESIPPAVRQRLQADFPDVLGGY